MQALALLMRGDGARSFLEPKSLSDICEDLLPLLEHGLQAQASRHIPCTPRCRTAQQRQRAEALALAAINVLDLSLFSTAVLGLPAGLRHPALWLLCAVFRLACMPESCMHGRPEDLSGSPRLGKSPGHACSHCLAWCIAVRSMAPMKCELTCQAASITMT